MEENKNEVVETPVKENTPIETMGVEEKKKNVGFVVILIMLVVFGLGIGVGIGLFANKQNDSPETPTKTTEKTEKETKEKEETKEEPTEEKEEATTENQIEVDYEPIIHYTTLYQASLYPFETKDLDFQDVFYIAWAYARGTKQIGIDDDITKAQMKDFISQLYGSDYAYEDQDVPCFAGDGLLFKFDGEKYHKDGYHGHDGNSFHRFKSYYVTKKEVNGTLVVQYKILYAGICGGTCGPATTYYKDTDFEGTPVFETRDDTITYDDVYEQVKEQIPITTFTFKKDSTGRYYLQSVKVA